jgi:hypothetical protein
MIVQRKIKYLITPSKSLDKRLKTAGYCNEALSNMAGAETVARQ